VSENFCITDEFTERGIKGHHGYMAERVVEDERHVLDKRELLSPFGARCHRARGARGRAGPGLAPRRSCRLTGLQDLPDESARGDRSLFDGGPCMLPWRGTATLAVVAVLR
jgi:hypothetical protein